jgi:predicted P-loop ATPase
MKPLRELSAHELLSQSSAACADFIKGGPDLRDHYKSATDDPELKSEIDWQWDDAEAQPPPKPEPQTSSPTLAPQIPAGSSVSGKRLWRPGQARAKSSTEQAQPASKLDAVVAELAAKAKATLPAVKPAVAPEAKKRALVKFNPIRNPYSLNAFENARIALEQMQFDCALDLFHSKPVISGEHAWLGGDGFEDLDNVVLKLRQLILEEFGFDTKNGIFDALKARCLDNAFDPVLDYLDKVEWDGKRRLDTWLIDYATADDTPLNRAFGRKTLIAAVRRARDPGCKFDYLLVLEGAQGIGKSTLVLTLAGEEFYSDKPIIGCDTKEQQESIQGVWIYEIAELEGLSKVDLNWMKGFLSRTHDKARPAFGRLVVDRPRRGIMIGTTNDDTYLRDTTGNRRWWPVRLRGRIDLTALQRDRDQLWAEAAAAEATGESLVIPEHLWVAAAVEQQARMDIDAWQEPIADRLRTLEHNRANLDGWFSSKGADKNCVPEFRVSSAYLLGDVLDIPESHRTNRETKRLAEVMRTLGWKLAEHTIKVGKKPCRAYYKPQPQQETKE